MGYVRQDEIVPITAKEHLLSNWEKYDLVDKKDDFIALLNVLQACGENLDSLHNVVINGEVEFCDIYHGGGWNAGRDVVNSLFEFCTFYNSREELIDSIIERIEDYDDISEFVEDIVDEITDDSSGNNDVQITKTEDGYVRRIWY